MGQKISSAQFFLTLFVSRAVVAIGLNARYLGGGNTLEAIVSYALAMAASLPLTLPVWALARRRPGLTIGDAAQEALGPAGKVVPALYIVYFLQSGAASLGVFELFLMDTVNPEFSADLAMAATLAVAVAGALWGLEAVARSAVCVFALLVGGSLLVFGIVSARFDPENLEPVSLRGVVQTFRGTLLLALRSSVFADLAVLLPFVRGRGGRGFLLWAAGATLFVSVTLLLLAGCLGPYAATRSFPIYSLASLSQARSLQRLDAVFLGVWMTGLIVKLSCELFACRVCVQSLAGRPLPGADALLPGAALLGLALAGVKIQWVQRVLLDVRLLLFCGVMVSLLLPGVVLLAGRKKRKSRQNEESGVSQG